MQGDQAVTQQYWFKKKKYGYGWRPGTSQGWIALVAYILLIVGLGWYVLQGTSDMIMRVTIYFVGSSLLTTGFIWLCWKKGEPLR